MQVPPDKQRILENLEARGHRVYKWCRRVGVTRRHFYYVVGAERGKKKGGPKTELIWAELRKDGIID